MLPSCSSHYGHFQTPGLRKRMMVAVVMISSIYPLSCARRRDSAAVVMDGYWVQALPAGLIFPDALTRTAWVASLTQPGATQIDSAGGIRKQSILSDKNILDILPTARPSRIWAIEKAGDYFLHLYDIAQNQIEITAPRGPKAFEDHRVATADSARVIWWINASDELCRASFGEYDCTVVSKSKPEFASLRASPDGRLLIVFYAGASQGPQNQSELYLIRAADNHLQVVDSTLIARPAELIPGGWDDALFIKSAAAMLAVNIGNDRLARTLPFNEQILDVARAGSKSVWIAPASGGIYRLTIIGGQWRRYDHFVTPETFPQITAGFDDRFAVALGNDRSVQVVLKGGAPEYAGTLPANGYALGEILGRTDQHLWFVDSARHVVFIDRTGRILHSKTKLAGEHRLLLEPSSPNFGDSVLWIPLTKGLQQVFVKTQTVGAHLAPNVVVNHIAVNGPDRLWLSVEDENESFVIGPARDVDSVAVQLGKGRLTRVSRKTQKVALANGLDAGPTDVRPNPTAVVTLLLPQQRTIGFGARYGIEITRDDERLMCGDSKDTLLVLRGRDCENREFAAGPANVTLRYTDALGSNMTFTWSDVVFTVPQAPFVWKPTALAYFSFLALVILAYVGMVYFTFPPILASLPWLGTAVLIAMPPAGVNSLILLGLVGLTFPAAAFSGLLPPVLLRKLAVRPQFMDLALALLSFSRIRKEHYRSYVNKLEKKHAKAGVIEARITERPFGASYDAPAVSITTGNAGTEIARRLAGEKRYAITRKARNVDAATVKTHVVVTDLEERAEVELISAVVSEMVKLFRWNAHKRIPVILVRARDNFAGEIAIVVDDDTRISPTIFENEQKEGAFAVCIRSCDATDWETQIVGLKAFTGGLGSRTPCLIVVRSLDSEKYAALEDALAEADTITTVVPVSEKVHA